jgi:hypothetical protein
MRRMICTRDSIDMDARFVRLLSYHDTCKTRVKK